MKKVRFILRVQEIPTSKVGIIAFPLEDGRPRSGYRLFLQQGLKAALDF